MLRLRHTIENGVYILEKWPAQSPEQVINIIENLWNEVKRAVYMRFPKK